MMCTVLGSRLSLSSERVHPQFIPLSNAGQFASFFFIALALNGMNGVTIIETKIPQLIVCQRLVL
jgi:hypothetical protein